MSRDFQDYLDYLEKTEDEQYYEQQKWLLNEYIDYIDCDYKQVKTGHIKEFLEILENEYSYQIVQKAYYNIKSFYEWLEDWEEIEENKAENIQIGSIIDRTTLREQNQKGKYDHLEEDEVEALLNNVPNPVLRNRLIIRTMLATGVRAGELVNIKLDDVELEENRIRIRTLKGGDVRYVYFPDALKIELRDWIDTQREAICQPKENYLFLSANAETKGQQLSRYRPNRIVKQAADRAGINEVIYEDAAGREHYRITSHILRHTFAHRMLYGDSDMDLNTLSALLGHSTTAETAETYLHPSEEMIKQEYDKASGDLSI